MKKSALIKLLEEIEGDPEIKLWNGFVGDWVDISPKVEKCDLVRLTQRYWLESIRLEECIDRKDWSYQLPVDEVATLKKNYTNVCKWEFNLYATSDQLDRKKYGVKSVYIIQAKIKGEKSVDRIGEMNY